MGEPRIGLALGSGGARGWCHIGVVRAMAEMGLRPGMVAGCSMGAVVGAAVAGGRLDALEAWARDLSATSVLGYIDMRLSGGGILEGGEVGRLLSDLGLPERIEDLDLPFATVATDLSTGDEVWFTQGDLTNAVRGSLSIPGVFRPHPCDAQWLLDGALCNPVPVSLARHLGADAIVAVDPNATGAGPMWNPVAPQPPAQTLLSRVAQIEVLPAAIREWFTSDTDATPDLRRVPNYFDVVGTAIDIMQVKLLEYRMQFDAPDVLLNADLKGVGILELHRADETIAHGHEMVAADRARLAALTGS